MRIGMILDNGAFGDQAWNICQIEDFCNRYGAKSVSVHCARDFFYRNMNDVHVIPPMPEVFGLWSMCTLIDSIHFDYDRNNHIASYNNIAKNYDIFTFAMSCNYEPAERRDIRGNFRWVSMLPRLSDKPIATLHPLSLDKKPKDKLDYYMNTWDHTIQEVLNMGFEIILLGAGKDVQLYKQIIPEHLYKHLKDYTNQLTYMQSLDVVLNQADLVLSTDSWTGLYGIASNKPTCMQLGYKMEFGRDFELMKYLGNRDCYTTQFISKKEQADLAIADWIDGRFTK